MRVAVVYSIGYTKFSEKLFALQWNCGICSLRKLMEHELVPKTNYISQEEPTSAEASTLKPWRQLYMYTVVTPKISLVRSYDSTGSCVMIVDLKDELLSQMHLFHILILIL